MDRRQMIVQRVREIFGERLDDVLHMVRQDRQDMRGWQEPAHVRGGPAASGSPRGSVGRLPNRNGVAHVRGRGRNSSTSAGEPDGGQQREAMGRMLEAGAAGLEKVIGGAGELEE